MKQKNMYSIKFLKYSGIIYVLGLIYVAISIIWKANSGSNGIPNNGGHNGGYIGIPSIVAEVLIITLISTVLNFMFSKPKPKDKYLRFLPIFILIAAFLISISATFLTFLITLFIFVVLIYLLKKWYY